MAKKNGKHKKQHGGHRGGMHGHGGYDARMYGQGEVPYGMGYGAPHARQEWTGYPGGMGGDFQSGMAAGWGSQPGMAGVMQQLPAFLRTGNSEQFLMGALLGVAAAWVLTDEELRGKILKGVMKVYAGAAGGFEEMKEQMADLKAEVEAERHGEM